MTLPKLSSRRVEAPDSLDAINDLYYERGWTDGLPIVPPTEERVRAMLALLGREPQESLGKMGPGNGTVTLEKLAVNAVMAGCKPEHFPVVVAAVKALLAEEFNIAGVSATTGGAVPLIVVNGPIAGELGINADTGAFGAGYRANACIGRAVRLAMRNLGGARPGEVDKSTLGHPGKYTFCIAENEERSPWNPFHVDLGYQPEESTVTVVGITGFHPIIEASAGSGRDVLKTVCSAITPWGTLAFYVPAREAQVVLVLGPEHAREIAEAGFSKRDVQMYVFQHARFPVGQLRGHTYWEGRTWPAWIDDTNDNEMVPAVSRPENVLVFVVGGDGRHSAWLPTWLSTRAVTVAIER
ncbi:MAG: hypothetical protein HYY00_05650 [Chloroflexi bacterium]|nr:hypothetical protein [Chloroflexota bacterium]